MLKEQFCLKLPASLCQWLVAAQFPGPKGAADRSFLSVSDCLLLRGGWGLIYLPEEEKALPGQREENTRLDIFPASILIFPAG